ncbi:MAG: YdeI/OmpD-associated family protein [Tannerellaceae bacterium]|jgi:hypothetical protein|nr:YdeI/OmpD-associated family protein [Tannerellaceae bacterium]
MMTTHPIVAKLKLNGYADKLFLNVPPHVQAFEGMDFDLSPQKSSYDLIFAFIFSINEFISLLRQVIAGNLLNKDGYLYVAYPKKGNKTYDCHIGRDDFFGPAGMDADGFVMNSRIKFNKMVAFNETFTCIGLKHISAVVPKTSAPSQCVADYVDRIPDLCAYWSAANPSILAIFNALTPGYRRDWARFVYGVRSGETSLRRLEEMAKALGEGFKSIDLYRRKANR